MKDLTGHWESTQWDWDAIDVDSFHDYDDPVGRYLVRDQHGPLNRFSDKNQASDWLDDAVNDGYDLPLFLDDLHLEIILKTRD